MKRPGFEIFKFVYELELHQGFGDPSKLCERGIEVGVDLRIDPLMLTSTSPRRPSETSTIDTPGEHIDHALVSLLTIAIRRDRRAFPVRSPVNTGP
jgi:hypothetical protein